MTARHVISKKTTSQGCWWKNNISRDLARIKYITESNDRREHCLPSSQYIVREAFSLASDICQSPDPSLKARSHNVIPIVMCEQSNSRYSNRSSYRSQESNMFDSCDPTDDRSDVWTLLRSVWRPVCKPMQIIWPLKEVGEVMFLVLLFVCLCVCFVSACQQNYRESRA